MSGFVSERNPAREHLPQIRITMMDSNVKTFFSFSLEDSSQLVKRNNEATHPYHDLFKRETIFNIHGNCCSNNILTLNTFDVLYRLT